ncbi:MAG TPA: nuclear transport factor 2 family protein [Thermoanaerobaculia bacterium]|nr:nuclear transport factor 2 family protein [Thermoanaerobaculia bacterium]
MRRLAIPAVLLFLFGSAASAQPRRRGRFASPDEHDLRQAVDSMNSFWNRGDARNYATALSDDTDWENAAGWRIRGRAGVERFLGQYLWRGGRPAFRPTGERVRLLAPDLAAVEQDAEASSTVEPGGPPRRVREMQFFQKRGGRWQVISTRFWEPVRGPRPPQIPGLSPEPFRR